MKVLNLRCERDHSFEGWFASEDDFQSQFDRGLVECPLCGGKSITRLPTAPRLNVSRSRALVAPPSDDSSPPVSPEAHTIQDMWLRAVQHVLASTDDVGERFAEEARRMHYGETEERAIRGKASVADAQALQEEGIEVLSMPLPLAAKGTLQ